ncbi:MAG: nucleotidyl transferase AbiEii/AbiGii toxin family protein, partial [Bacteroidales bacterium]|nr:nucleotidyl transferase AbiEii/AbiGii toxin family protein [Bacteroidales bacterium]
MNSYFAITDEQRLEILKNTAEYTGLSKIAVEKDVWVTCVLQMLFASNISGDIIFKGGTSLSKDYNLIERFSEDIDISVNPQVFGMESEDPTKKQMKKLRKASSLYVEEVLANKIKNAIIENKLSDFLSVETEPLGEGDKTYPEPRKIFIRYNSVIAEKIDYIKNYIILEIGARALMEPVNRVYVQSEVQKCYPHIITSVANPVIITAAPQKTFIEKAFLLHELFSVPHEQLSANRRSRHLYDLERMMDKDFAINAI